MSDEKPELTLPLGIALLLTFTYAFYAFYDDVPAYMLVLLGVAAVALDVRALLVLRARMAWGRGKTGAMSIVLLIVLAIPIVIALARRG
jgi:hypothetical protein